MEKVEIDKGSAAGDAESILNLGPRQSQTILQNRNSSEAKAKKESTDTTEQLIADEKEQERHPQRSGVAEWRGDAAPEAHLRDSVVYEVDEDDAGAGKLRLSFYEVTQQRDQSLYEKASYSSDVIRVWNQISHYIKSRMRQGSGVDIPGLGTLTTVVSKVTLNADPNRFALQRLPIFVLSKTLVERYKIIDPSDQICGFRVPASLLNLSEVGVRAKVSRVVVDGIVTEVLQTFARALVCGKPIEFPFPFIGKLQIRNRRCKMLFYAEFLRSMGHSCPGTSNRKKSTAAEMAQLEDIDDSDILPGRITPLNAHIPTESFRSVFHLREVRSVHEMITVTEEDLRRLSCAQVECVARSDSIAGDLDSDWSSVDLSTTECDSPPPFVWCPPERLVEEDGEGIVPTLKLFEGEDGETGDIEAWIAHARMSGPTFHANYAAEEGGEMAGEFEFEERPVTPAPSLRSPQEEVTARSLPEPEEWEVEAGRPCRHSFRPEPLYKATPSGNYALDILLPQKIHLANALVNHHVTICAKSLGKAEVMKHLGGATNAASPTVGLNSSFHRF